MEVNPRIIVFYVLVQIVDQISIQLNCETNSLIQKSK